MRPVLHNFFRSSTSYRVRVALALKGVDYDYAAYALRKDEHHGEKYLAVNPEGLVPALVWDDGNAYSQSLAIIEFLDEKIPDPPLLPGTVEARARVRALSYAVACDIHPLNNLRVLNMLKSHFGADDEAVADWFRHWVSEAFGPMEQRLSGEPETGRFCHGDTVTMADLCLVAQVANDARFKVDMAPFPTIQRIYDACMEIEAFKTAAPANQPDAE
jgi:maleylpyruvate isomerase